MVTPCLLRIRIKYQHDKCATAPLARLPVPIKFNQTTLLMVMEIKSTPGRAGLESQGRHNEDWCRDAVWHNDGGWFLEVAVGGGGDA